MQSGPIGIFDSGYGGLTILSEIAKLMPEYDYIYLGDNARTPYGTRSFETVYTFTLQAVKRLMHMGSPLVILACNTASAKALRTIQQRDLEKIEPSRRILGVIRPTVEIIGNITKSRKIGILGTTGTIQSQSYTLEINKLYPDMEVFGQACPMLVPIVENEEHKSPGADYFIKKYIDELISKSPEIDTVILGCTHYPMLIDKIIKYLPEGVTPVSQGGLVAASLKDYLIRHPEMENRCTRGGKILYYTTDSADKFESAAKLFLDKNITAEKINLE
ncbi:MAG: glutamate racemase [Bacteroidales bacterium]